MAAAFNDKLRQLLAAVGLIDFDVYGPYIEGIVSDKDTTDTEKKDALVDFLSAATDKGVPHLCEDILAAWAASHSKPVEKKAEAPKRDVIEELKNEMKAVQVSAVAKGDKPRLTKEEKEEKKKKDALLARFAYEQEDVDANGDILIRDHSRDDADADAGLSANTNASAIADAERRKREKSKQDHEKKVARDKELQAKQAEEREKAKKRTQKQERRGRGY